MPSALAVLQTLPEEAIRWILDYWTSLPLWLQILISIVIGLFGTHWFLEKIVIRFVQWRTQRKAFSELESAAVSEDFPMRNPDAGYRIYRPARIDLLDSLDIVTRILTAWRLKKRPEWKEIAKVHDTADQMVTRAYFEAGNIHALGALPPRIRRPVQIRLAWQLLKKVRAHQDTLNMVEIEINEMGENMLVSALFSKNVLRAVDLSPGVGSGKDYLTKYFQHVLIAFQDPKFRRSCGAEVEVDEALVTHLKSLTNRRVRAALLLENSPPCEDVTLQDCLPSKVPSGHSSRDRETRRIFNAKKSAEAVVFISDAKSTTLLAKYDLVVERTLHAYEEKDAEFLRWSPNAPSQHNVFCSLWQKIPIRDQAGWDVRS